MRGGYRPYFENYTVDASIFEMILFGLFRSMILKIISQFLIQALAAWVASFDSNSCDFQVFKSKRWMPWHLEPKKDVAICDKPRGTDKRVLIRGCPNGETPLGGVPT